MKETIPTKQELRIIRLITQLTKNQIIIIRKTGLKGLQIKNIDTGTVLQCAIKSKQIVGY